VSFEWFAVPSSCLSGSSPFVFVSLLLLHPTAVIILRLWLIPVFRFPPDFLLGYPSG